MMPFMAPLATIAVVVRVAGFIEASLYAVATARGLNPVRSGEDEAFSEGRRIGISDRPRTAATSPRSRAGTIAAFVLA